MAFVANLNYSQEWKTEKEKKLYRKLFLPNAYDE